MKRKLVGWLLVGLPIAIFFGFAALLGGLKIILALIAIMAGCAIMGIAVNLGVELLRE